MKEVNLTNYPTVEVHFNLQVICRLWLHYSHNLTFILCIAAISALISCSIRWSRDAMNMLGQAQASRLWMTFKLRKRNCLSRGFYSTPVCLQEDYILISFLPYRLCSKPPHDAFSLCFRQTTFKICCERITRVHSQRFMRHLLDSSAVDVGWQHHHEGAVDVFVFKQLSCCIKEQQMRKTWCDKSALKKGTQCFTFIIHIYF